MPTWGRVECLGLAGGGTDAVRGWERARRCLPHVKSGILASFPMLRASLAVDVSASPGGVARRRSKLLSCSQRFCFVFHGHCHLPSERNPLTGCASCFASGGTTFGCRRSHHLPPRLWVSLRWSLLEDPSFPPLVSVTVLRLWIVSVHVVAMGRMSAGGRWTSHRKRHRPPHVAD